MISSMLENTESQVDYLSSTVSRHLARKISGPQSTAKQTTVMYLWQSLYPLLNDLQCITFTAELFTA